MFLYILLLSVFSTGLAVDVKTCDEEYGYQNDIQHLDNYYNKESISHAQSNIHDFLYKGFDIAKNKQLYRTEVFHSHAYKYRHFGSALKRPKTSTIKKVSCYGSGLLETTKIIAESSNLTRAHAYKALTSITIPSHILKDLSKNCAIPVPEEEIPKDSYPETCIKNAYRTASGVCNNPKHYKWGAAQQPFQRLLAPDYSDGFDSPRGFNKLPNPRLISLLLKDRPTPPKSKRVTQMLKLWGQFLDHDVVKTPETPVGIDIHGSTIDMPCCEEGKLEETSLESCLPIVIPQGDTFYNKIGIQCLRFVRSLPFSSQSHLQPREQLSEITAFIDASNVYGSSLEEFNDLRSFVGGRLRVGIGSEGQCAHSCPLTYLRESDDPDGDDHFLAGDARSNEQPSLTSMHTIWLRLHNLIADQLNYSYGGTDELIFQECRKIVGAMMQHITYTEFLPLVIGQSFMSHNGLQTPNLNHIDAHGYNVFYDAHRNPTIFNVFGAAAFRFGHTLISNNMAGQEPFLLERNFFNGVMQKNFVTHPSYILEKESLFHAEGVDSFLDDAIVNKLLAEEPFTHGNDLMSLNIQRGRDHGIPSYNYWRAFCGLKPFKNFHQMKKELDPVTVAAFASAYKSVNDVDLFPAGLAENPISDGILGPTLSCILLKQFTNLKYGDRFWYENGPSIHTHNHKAAFSPNQLSLIRKTSLAYVLCQTANLYYVPQKPMEVSGCYDSKSYVTCTDLLKNGLLEEIRKGNWH